MKDFRIPSTDAHVFYIIQPQDYHIKASSEIIKQTIKMFYKHADNNPVISFQELNQPQYFLDNLNINSVLIAICPNPESGEYQWMPMPIDGKHVEAIRKMLQEGTYQTTFDAVSGYIDQHRQELIDETGWEEGMSTEEVMEKRKPVIAFV